MAYHSEMKRLEGKKIAILVTNGFEQDELLQPLDALQTEGAQVDIISPEHGPIKGWKEKNWGEKVSVDVKLHEAHPEDYDGIVLPGGVINPDQLRMIPEAVQFIQYFVEREMPIAAICHGPWTLIETGIFSEGRTVTSWPSLKSDLENAGAIWVDQEVVVDHGLITSRNPTDIPVFNQKMIEEFAEGSHKNRIPKERMNYENQRTIH